MTEKINSITYLPLKKVWPNEAKDFTPWLAEEENLLILSEAIGLNLEFKEREVPVGGFSADILCKNADAVSDADSLVIIENKFNKIDHDHIGKALTYAINLGAATIIWIAEKFTDEHRAVLDWLNENTTTGFHFFGLEVKVIKIGNSDSAVMFDIVSKPNETLKDSTRKAKVGLSSNEQLQYDYWKSLYDYLKESKSKVKIRSYSPINHNHIRTLGKGSILRATISTQKGEATIILLLGKNMENKFDELHEKQSELENNFGYPLEFNDGDDENASATIKLIRSFKIKDNESNWEDSHKWFKENLETFIAVFEPLLKKSS